MSKSANEAKRAAAAHAEELKLVQEKLDAAGLGHAGHELPPMTEEEEKAMEQELKKSAWDTFMSMIPGTEQSYEAQYAEEEMNNLQKIQIEEAKAADLLAMTKMGRHEDALSTMMSETNNDFFFFNKLKDAMEKDGRYKTKKTDLNPFADLETGKNRNRIKKGAYVQFSVFDEETQKALDKIAASNAARAEAKAGGSKKKKGIQPCSWRGKSKDGEFLECTNLRLVHPSKTILDDDNKTPIPVVMAHCQYHTPECIGQIHIDAGIPAKITAANREGLCGECYTNKTKSKVVGIALELVPGVRPLSLIVTKLDRKEGNEYGGGEQLLDAKGKPLTEHSLCTWKPHVFDIEQRAYHCTNTVAKNPYTGALMRTCLYHTKVCVRHHAEQDNYIAIPNKYGLCNMHHIGEHGALPIELTFPYPGTRLKNQKAEWMIETGHWAAPPWAPDDEHDVAEYERDTFLQQLLNIDLSEDLLDQTFNILSWMVDKVGYRFGYIYRYYRYSKKKVVIIQRAFRRFRKKNLHLRMKIEGKPFIRRRNLAAIRIQCLARRMIARIFAKNRRAEWTTASIYIQKIFRGNRVRKIERRKWASRRIMKLMKRLRFFKFKDAVIVVMQLRLGFMKRINSSIQIQRFARGYLVRKHNFEVKLFEFVMNRCVRIIQKAVKAWLKRKAVRIFVYPSEDWVIKQCAKKLAHLILEMYFAPDRAKRRQLAIEMSNQAPKMQRLMRGFLGRAGARKMKFLRKALRSWCEPQMAIEFMRKFMESKVFYLNQKKQVSNIVAVSAPKREPNAIRKLLPEKLMDEQEVPPKVFIAAFTQYYLNEDIPLMSSELTSVCNRFRNPANGKINVTMCDAFICMHEIPCRKHGRKVCGDCVFSGKCLIKDCECVMHVPSSGKDGSICLTCSHPPSWHTICPLHMKQKILKKKSQRAVSRGKKASNMLAIMEAINHVKPDLSMPSLVQGAPVNKLVDPPPDPLVARFKDDRNARLAKKAQDLNKVKSLNVSQKLVYGRTRVADIPNDNSYWEQTEMNLLAPATNPGTQARERDFNSTYVKADDHEPYTDVTQAEFWSAADMLPNKRPRDYHEKFDHAMPMPVVENGKLYYTLEGPKMYLNIMVKLGKMEQHIHYDDPLMCRLVVDHIQIFERHWRKMVADLRTGKLNRNLEVSKEQRITYESTHLPRPDLAKRLDDTFRQLGFHQKVLGKDIKITQFAEKRKLPSIAAMGTGSGTAVQPKDTLMIKSPLRRPSLQITPGHSETNTPIHSQLNSPVGSRTNTPKGRRSNTPSNSRPSSGVMFSSNSPRASMMSPNKLGILYDDHDSVASFDESTIAEDDSVVDPKFDTIGEGLGKTKNNVTKRADSPATGRSMPIKPLSPGGSKMIERGGKSPDKTRSGSAGRSRSQHDKQMEYFGKVANALDPTVLNEYKGQVKEIEERGPSRRTIKDVRRGSDTDILHPTSVVELQKVTYDNETAPRDGYHIAIETLGPSKFVCPFPACGKYFKTKDAAFLHLPFHEHKMRLSAPTPLPDSHMNFYWPAGVPWHANAKYVEKTLAPGSLPCPVPGCDVTMPNQERLDAHMRLAHQHSGPSSLLTGYFSFDGACVSVPPFEPPKDASVFYCSHHYKPSGKCPICIDVEDGGGPQPPFKFYETLVFDFQKKPKEKDSTGNDKSSRSDGGPEVVVRFQRNDKTCCIILTGGGTKANFAANAEWRGEVTGILLDRKQCGWVCVKPLYTFRDAVDKGVPIPRDFDKQFELLRPSDFDTGIWVPVVHVSGQGKVVFSSKTEFREKMKKKEIPSKAAYFVRD